MNEFFAKLALIFTSGPELLEIIQEKRVARIHREAEENRYRLKLCYKHRQEQNRSHFAEHNCDHCKALARIKILEAGQ